ncbi:MAG: hypothetical protein A2289_07415 [Deltaproteobacteria bacterium RIFOXYA12_FULL_58_15]|nr:MAG: hypothetical protein A2289_07415 [Deltaproteobacteria bacterium RIFOXYA12_FULL_58_15]
MAVTDLAALMVTTQVAVVPQDVPSPDQPAKVLLAPGAAVSVTLVPLLYEYEHVEPQLMPAGFEVTVPVPVPAFVTVNA